MTRVRLLWAVLWLAALPGIALAWGEDGHIVTARIAEAHLSERARAGIRELIGDRSIADKNICVWADQIRSTGELKEKYPDNASWHYINLDVADDKPDPLAAKFDKNVLAAIGRFCKVLKDRKADPADRKEALLFLVHFISDLHQPLHCVARNDDRGGNRVMVLYPGQNEPKRLHAIWDTELVRATMNSLEPADYATRLNQRIAEADRKEWMANEVKDWALEGHGLAREVVYAPIPKDWPLDGKAFELMEEYVKKSAPVIERQLQRGGIRLAKVLNEAFAD